MPSPTCVIFVAAVAALSVSSTAMAQSLDCEVLDPVSCGAVLDIVGSVNDEVGYALLHEAAPQVRFRPSNIYQRLRQVQVRMDAADCSVQGHGGGKYDVAAARRAWSGELTWDDWTTTAGGVCSTAPNAWSGYAIGETANRPIGADVGVFNAETQLAGDLDDSGWIAGHWLRLQGSRGVWVALAGECAPFADAGSVLDGWYEGSLPAFEPPTARVNETLVEHGVCDGDNAMVGSPFATLGIIECFRSSLHDELILDALNVTITNALFDPFTAVNLRSWDGSGLPGPVVRTVPAPENANLLGPQPLQLAVPLDDSDFCVELETEGGLHGATHSMPVSSTGAPGTSFVRWGGVFAPTAKWCISAEVSGY